MRNPPANSDKYFAASELLVQVKDRPWLAKVTNALNQHWQVRNAARKTQLSARSRRAIDWTQISARLGLGGPKTLWRALYQQHKELLDRFGKMALELGRMEQGTFHWPQSAGPPNAKLRLAPQALQLLLNGVDLKDGARPIAESAFCAPARTQRCAGDGHFLIIRGLAVRLAWIGYWHE